MNNHSIPQMAPAVKKHFLSAGDRVCACAKTRTFDHALDKHVYIPTTTFGTIIAIQKTMCGKIVSISSDDGGLKNFYAWQVEVVA